MINDIVLLLAVVFTALVAVFGIKLYDIAEKHKTIAGKIKAIANYIAKNKTADLQMLTLLSDLLNTAGYSDIANALTLAVYQSASALQTQNKTTEIQK